MCASSHLIINLLAALIFIVSIMCFYLKTALCPTHRAGALTGPLLCVLLRRFHNVSFRVLESIGMTKWLRWREGQRKCLCERLRESHTCIVVSGLTQQWQAAHSRSFEYFSVDTVNQHQKQKSPNPCGEEAKIVSLCIKSP